MEFTYDAYRDLITLIRNEGYRLTSFSEEDKACAFQAIIRHDVDVSPVKARVIANIEVSLEVRSTFFFMISSEWYNLMDFHNEAALKDIMKMGHEIGLHFDISKYSIRDDSELEHHVLKEISVLSNILSTPVRSVSWHIPERCYYNRELPFMKDRCIKNAYDPEYVSGYKYMSDSNMTWREDPNQYIKTMKYPRLQVLTHPVWYEAVNRQKKDILFTEVRNKIISMHRYLEAISPDTKI